MAESLERWLQRIRTARDLCQWLSHDVVHVQSLDSGCVGESPWYNVSLGEHNRVLWTERPGEKARQAERSSEQRWYALLHEACHGALYNAEIPLEEHEDVYSDHAQGGGLMALEHALVRQYAPSLLRSLLREHCTWHMPLSNDPPDWLQATKTTTASARRKYWLARSYERVRQASAVADLFTRVGVSTEYRASA